MWICWIGKGLKVPLDLNPFDFYLFGHIKDLLYAADVPNVHSMRDYFKGFLDLVCETNPKSCKSIIVSHIQLKYIS